MLDSWSYLKLTDVQYTVTEIAIWPCPVYHSAPLSVNLLSHTLLGSHLGIPCRKTNHIVCLDKTQLYGLAFFPCLLWFAALLNCDKLEKTPQMNIILNELWILSYFAFEQVFIPLARLLSAGRIGFLPLLPCSTLNIFFINSIIN